MTIAVELQRSDLAEVVITPSLIRRMLWRERESVRVAVRVLVETGGWGWAWDDTRKMVEPNVAHAIERAVRAAQPQEQAS